jgi:hypothetical protein
MGAQELNLKGKDEIVLVEGDSSRMHGWLQKSVKGGFFGGSWKRMFVAVEEGKFRYYTDQLR